MNPELIKLFRAALDLAPDERDAFLALYCQDQAMRAELDALILNSQLTEQEHIPTPAKLLEAANLKNAPIERAGAADIVGAFRLIRHIGSGGMGAVWLAERVEGFHQFVAIKWAHAALYSEAAKFRFTQERQLLAKLNHPNIARIVDGGSDHDFAWYAMEYVEGLPLDEYVRTRELNLAERIKCLIAVCEAVQYAHQQLIVHRDLKPSNILVQTDGTIKLLDFGIAKQLDDADSMTMSRAPLTYSYASPEQIRGDTISTVSDVYALGVVLFELLTGALPHQLKSQGALSLAQAITDTDSIAPSVLLEKSSTENRSQIRAAQLRGDLDTIVLKALQRDPARRYSSAQALADDLNRFNLGQPIAAQPDSIRYRAQKFIRRHKLATGFAASALIAIVVGVGGVMWQARQTALERDQVVQEMRRTEAVKSYLMLMFRSVGENQSETSTTAKQMLDQSAQQLVSQFSGQAQSRAEIVEAMGLLYLQMNDYDGAAPLLRSFLAANDISAESRATISALLSEVENARGNTAEARKLLDSAFAFWNRDPVRYRNNLLNNRIAQSVLEKIEVGPSKAIQTLKAGIVESKQYFSRSHTDTAIMLNSLGIAYQEQGELDLADKAFAESLAMFRELGEHRSASALLTLGNSATVAFRKNEFELAEKRLIEAASVRRELYGTSASLASMLGNIAKVVLRAKRPDEAMTYIEQALPMSRQFTGEHSTLTIYILQTKIEARIQLRQFQLATDELAQAKNAALKQTGEENLLYAICFGLEARLNLAQGKKKAASDLADIVEAKFKALGEVGAPYLSSIVELRKQISAAP